jgi:hypothetical protein
MKKLIKLISIWLLPIAFIILVIFSIRVFVSDFRFGHQTSMVYQNPFPWAKYFVTVSIKKFIIKTFNNQELGLPHRYMYLNEQSEQKLLSATPNSTKEWVDGYILNNSKKFQDIQIRYRGDNPRNWLLEKKSIRIKTKKTQLFGRKRYFEYFPFEIQKYISAKIAEDMGVLISKPKLIELYVNGQSDGIFVENEKINENFLRRNLFMPVNLYKGQNNSLESFIGLDTNLFNNPGMWTKLAVFNLEEEKNNSDLANFLFTLQASELSENFDISLDGYINLENHAKLSAYIVITQNRQYHRFANQRLFLDPWSGYVNQIIVDPSMGNGVNGKFALDFSTNDLTALLHRSSEFNHAKYMSLLYFIKDAEIIKKTLKFIEDIPKDFEVSLKRDPEMNSKKTLREFELVAQYLKSNEASIMKQFNSIPNARWKKNDNGFSIFINDKMPISDIKLSFLKDKPGWVSLDENYNGLVDENELKFFSSKDNYIYIPVTIYSNRLKVTNKKVSMHSQFDIETANTKFNIITENNIIPNTVVATNPFSQKSFVIKNENINGVQKNKFNKIIINNESKSDNNYKLLSGNIRVNTDLVYDFPVKIMPGTNFFVKEGKHIIFKDKVIANGLKNKPITFKKHNISSKPWGTIALVGVNSQNSELSNLIITGGSGGKYKQFIFTSMLSLHNTKNIKLENIELSNNSLFDDMIHLVYCENVVLNNLKLNYALNDAIDVDISNNIAIKNSQFIEPNNDAIDFMESTALVEFSTIIGSKDKGISVGENSNILIYNNLLKNNNLAIAVKDKSIAEIVETNFKNNNIQISAYSKNWQYGEGGTANVVNSTFESEINSLESSSSSKIYIDNSVINGEKKIKGKTVFINKDKKKDENYKILHPMYEQITF